LRSCIRPGESEFNRAALLVDAREGFAAAEIAGLAETLAQDHADCPAGVYPKPRIDALAPAIQRDARATSLGKDISVRESLQYEPRLNGANSQAGGRGD